MLLSPMKTPDNDLLFWVCALSFSSINELFLETLRIFESIISVAGKKSGYNLKFKSGLFLHFYECSCSWGKGMG